MDIGTHIHTSLSNAHKLLLMNSSQSQNIFFRTGSYTCSCITLLITYHVQVLNTSFYGIND